MTLEEKYPNVFKALEMWSAEWKPLLKERFDRGVLAPYEYTLIMTKLCLRTKEEAEVWLNEE